MLAEPRGAVSVSSARSVRVSPLPVAADGRLLFLLAVQRVVALFASLVSA